MINLWISKDFLSGGSIYSYMVFDVLKKREFNIVSKRAYTRYKGKGFTYMNAFYTYLFKTSSCNDLDIMDSKVAAWGSSKLKGKRVIIMFHFDINESRKKQKNQFLFNRFLKKAQDSKIVVISQYWKDYLTDLGLSNIEVIYCSFDTMKYQSYISKQDFFKKFHLPDKPIVYLGKNSISKTFNAYQIVKSLARDFLIVTTGPLREFDGPIHLNLDFKYYCSLLHFSSLTLLMPVFSEGWSRIAHESIICGTPVIGNGKGGMGELLQKSHQYILTCDQEEEIRQLIKTVVMKKQRVNSADIKFARSFNIKTFSNQWERLIRDIYNLCY